MEITHADIACTLVESTAWRRVQGDRAGEIEQIVYALNAAAVIAVEAERERIKAHLDTAILRYTGGDYARGWNDALAATLVHIFAQQNGSTK